MELIIDRWLHQNLWQTSYETEQECAYRLNQTYLQAYTKLVVCERFLNVQMSKQRGKNGSTSGPPSGWGAVMVQPVQWLICHWV